MSWIRARKLVEGYAHMGSRKTVSTGREVQLLGVELAREGGLEPDWGLEMALGQLS